MRDTSAKAIGARCSLLHEIAQRMAEGADWRIRSFVDDLNFYPGYSEPGYSGEIVITGNWNTIDIKGKLGNLPKRLGNLFEKAGASIEWSDEWTGCSNCGRAVRTSPDSYGWRRSYVMTNDCEIICCDCVNDDPASYMAEFEDNPNTAWTLNNNPEDYGYIRYAPDDPKEYETGFHPGQTDDPHKVYKELMAQGKHHILFRLTDVGQFDARWTVYYKENEGNEDSED